MSTINLNENKRNSIEESSDSVYLNVGSKEKFKFSQVVIILFVHILSLGSLYYYSWDAFLLFIMSYFVFGCLGVSIGYHKLLSHKSFDCHYLVRNTFATIGMFSFHGPPLFWAAVHRLHHMHTDKKGDAHARARGWFWSHLGWLFYENPNGFSYLKARKSVPDLNKSKYLLFLEKVTVPANMIVIFGGFFVAQYFNMLDVYFWTVPLRIVAIWHIVWFINSTVHSVEITEDGSSKPKIDNSFLVSLLFFGEGHHLNHHEKPFLPYNNKRTYDFDIGYWILCLFSLVGLVKFKHKSVKQNLE